MAAEYYIILRNPAGAKVAEITDFQELSYSKRIWEPGLLKFKLNGQHKDVLAGKFTNNAQAEVWRRNAAQGIDWYCDFYGLFRGELYETPANVDYFTASCPGQMTILSWAYVMYPDRLDNRSIFTGLPAETIMKTLVGYNVTALATTANGRINDWPVATLQQAVTVEMDLGRGNVQDWKCGSLNLLTTLQDLAQIAGGDFDLIKTGLATWEFRFYPGQRGTDRTATVKFSQAQGNMANPSYTYDRINEATVAIVGGRGDGSTQQFTTVFSPQYDPANNYIETFVHASNADTDAYLAAKGNEYLYAAQARRKLSFKVLQTPAVQYGRDYFLGDLVSAFYKGITFQQKFFGVSVTYRPGGDVLEEISVEMRDQ
jgi:hypothetical protein